MTEQTIFTPIFSFYQDHSSLIASISRFALNVIVFAGQLIKEMPAQITNGAHTLLSLSGLLTINQQIMEIIKKGKNVYFACRDGNLKEALFYLLKGSVALINLVLSVASIAASIFLFFSFPELAIPMWTLMHPISIASMACDLLNQVIDYFFNRHLITQIKKLNINDKENTLLHFHKYLINRPIERPKDKNARLARHIYQQMDNYYSSEIKKSWANTFSLTPKQSIIEQHFSEITQPLEDGLRCIEGNFRLFLFGQICLIVCKIWPRSLIDATAILTSSMLYTAQEIYYSIKKEEFITQLADK